MNFNLYYGGVEVYEGRKRKTGIPALLQYK